MNDFNKKYYTLIATCLLVLILAGLKWAVGLQSHVDILLADEAEYLRNGLNLFDKVAKNWGPTYNIWYKFLSFFTTDPVSLYYLNYKVGAIGVAAFLFLFLIRYHIHIAVAFLISFCFLFSDINMNAWPRITNFVLIVYLLLFIALKNVQSLSAKIIWFTIVSFIAAFARPELLIVAEASTAVALFFVIKDYKNIGRKIPLLLLLLLTAAVLFFVYGKPADSYSGIDRMYIAFCQHYAIAYRMRTHSNLNAVIEWIDFTRPLFGDCTTVPQILTKHFSLCIPHFIFTIKGYIFYFFTYLLNLVTPIYLITGSKKKLILLVAFILFIIAVLWNKNIRTSFLNKIKKHNTMLLLSFAFSIPSIGICVVIFPRQHYIMMQTIWMALLLGFLFTAILEELKVAAISVLPLALLLFFLSPKATAFTAIQGIPDITNLCTQKFIRFMNGQQWQGKHVIFSNILNIHLMFNESEKFEQFNTEYMLKQMPLDVKFKDIMETKKIDIIFMNDQLMEETRLKKDTTWLNLVAHPEVYHFKKVPYNNDCQSYLLIKK